ncbi:hypothetical protein [Lichenifustis flavocetrariae]|uniref:Uncharacterized protein n=1 Tax=Lichenifustis flavocetrariae TaxID=2949735 RepID=A0AA41Z129_9HYPH|nr:hypothetical protein [Lichenifustis flavocetrariae]MCW6507332.1 hypothetical protein [Lichenifustis flavocetrariae]
MSDLKIVADPDTQEQVEPVKAALPVLANDGVLTRRDLDMIKRDLITVRKDYCEIRDNLVVLTHQYARAPSRSFFVTFGLLWLIVLAGLLIFQPQLTNAGNRVVTAVKERIANR